MPKIILKFMDIEVTIDAGNALDEVSALAHAHMASLISSRANIQEPSAEDESPADRIDPLMAIPQPAAAAGAISHLYGYM